MEQTWPIFGLEQRRQLGFKGFIFEVVEFDFYSRMSLFVLLARRPARSPATLGNFCKWRILTIVSAEADKESDPNKAREYRYLSFIISGEWCDQPVKHGKTARK